MQIQLQLNSKPLSFTSQLTTTTKVRTIMSTTITSITITTTVTAAAATTTTRVLLQTSFSRSSASRVLNFFCTSLMMRNAVFRLDDGAEISPGSFELELRNVL